MAAAAEHEATAARRVAAARLDHAAGAPGRWGPPRGLVERMVGRALEAGAEVATATHHLVAGAEARLEAAGRLATSADDPAVRAAAGRVAQSAAAGPPLHTA